jgi:hypothetical protein
MYIVPFFSKQLCLKVSARVKEKINFKVLGGEMVTYLGKLYNYKSRC